MRRMFTVLASGVWGGLIGDGLGVSYGLHASSAVRCFSAQILLASAFWSVGWMGARFWLCRRGVLHWAGQGLQVVPRNVYGGAYWVPILGVGQAR
ncbi:hypothetical protein B0T22DRAFT_461617 [Podospora appendiculata]|uniref:Uncharacterized protein n=1 Tax=Podospora appendiculata TaxID=314037 RepID=A0AAE0XBE8_9PEZI|nr:hypothetical protein B0T22DRAFT_461617 [Podospora appendiculata]